jgi:hypothetical protein
MLAEVPDNSDGDAVPIGDPDDVPDTVEDPGCMVDAELMPPEPEMLLGVAIGV